MMFPFGSIVGRYAAHKKGEVDMTFYGEDFLPGCDAYCHKCGTAWKVERYKIHNCNREFTYSCGIHGTFYPQLVGHRCPDCLRFDLQREDDFREFYGEELGKFPAMGFDIIARDKMIVQRGNQIGKRTVTDFLLERYFGIVPVDEFKSKMLSDFVPPVVQRDNKYGKSPSLVGLHSYKETFLKHAKVLGKFKDDTVAVKMKEDGSIDEISHDEFYKTEEDVSAVETYDGFFDMEGE